MLHELIRLWWTQKRRDFGWKKVFIAGYLALCFIIVVAAFFFGMSEGGVDIWDLHFEAMAVTYAFAVVVPDLLMKVWWRHDPVEPDDYIRTRPFSRQAWSRFVLLQVFVSFVVWMVPLMFFVVDLMLMNLGYALLTLLLMLSASADNALVQNCWRRSSQASERVLIIIGYALWLGFGLVWMLMSLLWSSAWSLTSLMPISVYLAVNILFGMALQHAFGQMASYNESSQHRGGKVLGWGDVSLFSIEYVSVMRCKRMRTSVLFVGAIFLMNVYLQFLQPQLATSFNAHLMLLFAIAFPSVILGQWVLGIEANYFHGIWTKPYGVETILRNKFYFFCLLCTLMTLLSIPSAVWLYLRPAQLAATWLFSMGAFVLLMMPTCLFSSRMDLFGSAFFNYQGGNKQLNIYSFVILLPTAIYVCAYMFLPQAWMADVLTAALGIVGLALHRVFLHWLTGIWTRRRYAIMERWMKE